MFSGPVRLRAAVFILLLVGLLSGCASVEKRWRHAAALEERGDYAAAVGEYQELALRLEETDRARAAAAYVKAGECLVRLQRFVEALRLFEQALLADASNTAAHLRMAQLFAAGAPDRSLTHVRFVLQFEPENAEATAAMAAAYLSAGQPALARIAFERALQLEPKRTEVAVALAELHYREGQPALARDVLHRAAAADSRAPLPWLALGRLEEQEGDPDAAEEAYRRAVAAEDSPDTNLRLAQFLQRNARIAEAEERLRRADSLRPWLPTAVPDFELQSGRAEGALAGYQRALSSSAATPGAQEAAAPRAALVPRLVEAALAGPGGAEAARSLLGKHRAALDAATVRALEAEILLAEGKLEPARQAAEEAAQLAPESAAALFVRGAVLHRAGSVTEARQQWSAALESDPAFVPARLALAEEEMDAGAADLAEQHVALVLREEPANLRALCLFARVLLRQQRHDAALAIARRAVAAQPDAAEPQVVLAEVEAARGNPGAALIAYQQAVLADPGSQAAVEGLVRLYRLGRVTRAMLLRMERTASTPPASPTLLEIAGRLFRERGWDDDAERCFRRLLQLEPGREAARAELARLYAARGEVGAAAGTLARSDSAPAALLAARDAERRNDRETAIRGYEEALRRGEASGVAANNLAWLYAAAGVELDRALALAQQASAASPSNPSVLDTLGVVHLKRREYTQALEVLKKAFELARSPQAQPRLQQHELAQLREHLAEAYLRAGQPDAAAELEAMQ